MLRFLAPLSFSFILLASSAQAMFPDEKTDSNALENLGNEELVRILHSMMAPQQPAYDPYAGVAPFEKKVMNIISSPKESGEKKETLITLIKQDDTINSYEEKVNSILKYLPNSMSPNSSFSEAQSVEICKILVDQNPVEMFKLCTSPSFSPTSPPYIEFIDSNLKSAIFEGMLGHDFDLENRLKILKNIAQYGNFKSLTCIFNEYLFLKKKFDAPFRPKSFYHVESDQDLIAEFYVLNLARRVPEVLMNENLNLDFKEKLEFANRCKNDFFAGNRGSETSGYQTPQSLIDFYKFAATYKDAPLTCNEKFSVLEQLLTLSEGKEKQIVLDVLQNEKAPFDLRRKLSHLAKHSADQALQENGKAFITQHQKEIETDAIDRYRKLSVHSRMGIPPLRQKGASGKNVTVAVCDMGFYKILPHDIYRSDLMKSFANDEKSYQWKMLHEKQILAPRIFDGSWLTEIKNPNMPYHGSEMIDHVVTVAPEVQVIPVAVDSNSSKSLIDALNNLSEDPTVNIINCSFLFPDKSGVFDPEVKESLIKCLKNNKLLVLGVGNHDAFIPDDLSESKPVYVRWDERQGLSDLLFESGMRDGPKVLSSLFAGEDENSPLFSNLLLVGCSKANSLELYEKSVKPGNGPAQKRFVYADADAIETFFDDTPCWGGTSAATAMVSGLLADLWGEVKNPDKNTAARVCRAFTENTDIDLNISPRSRGCGKVNGGKALEKLDEF